MLIAKEKRGRRKSAERSKEYTAPALSKGLDILELLASESNGLSLREIADRLQRSKGEIFRMLVVLEQRAYVASETETDNYILTLKIFELAHQHPRIKRLTSAAAPYMLKLSKEIQQSCHLVIHYNGRGLIISQQDSFLDRRFGVRLGSEIALANTCSGHILLTYADTETRTEMLSQQPAHLRKNISKAAMTKMVSLIQKQGYESIDSKQIAGVKDIGYPIFDFSGKIAAALVVPFLKHLDNSNAVNFKKAQTIIKSSAESLSVALGYLPHK